MAFGLFNPCSPCCGGPTPPSGIETVCCTGSPILRWEIMHYRTYTGGGGETVQRVGGLGLLVLEEDGVWRGYAQQSVPGYGFDMKPFELISGELSCANDSQLTFKYSGLFAGESDGGERTLDIFSDCNISTSFSSLSPGSVLDPATPGYGNTVGYLITPFAPCDYTGDICWSYSPNNDTDCSGDVYKYPLSYNPTWRLWYGSGGPLDSGNVIVALNGDPVSPSGYTSVLYPCEKVIHRDFYFPSVTNDCSDLNFQNDSNGNTSFFNFGDITGINFACGCDIVNGTYRMVPNTGDIDCTTTLASGIIDTTKGSPGSIDPWRSGDLPVDLEPGFTTTDPNPTDTDYVFIGFPPVGDIQLPSAPDVPNFTDYLNDGGVIIVVSDGSASPTEITDLNDLIDDLGGTTDIVGNNLNPGGASGDIVENTFLFGGPDGLYYNGSNTLSPGQATTIVTAEGINSGIVTIEQIGGGFLIIIGDRDIINTPSNNNLPFWDKVTGERINDFVFSVTGNWICSGIPSTLYLSACTGIIDSVPLKYSQSQGFWFGTTECTAIRGPDSGNVLAHYFHMNPTISEVQLYMGSGSQIPNPEFVPFPVPTDSSPNCTPFFAQFTGTTSNMNIYCCDGASITFEITE